MGVIQHQISLDFFSWLPSTLLCAENLICRVGLLQSGLTISNHQLSCQLYRYWLQAATFKVPPTRRVAAAVLFKPNHLQGLQHNPMNAIGLVDSFCTRL